MKIYTRTGDKGKTKLLSGQCIEKSDPRVHVYGTTDELNSYLGLAILEIPEILEKQISEIQNELFNVGSLVACDDPKFIPNLPPIHQSSIDHMEQWIDEMTAELPPLKNFIIPGGSRGAALLHICRTICRRAEREFSGLTNRGPELELVGIYLNRLSDYLFVLARYVNLKAGNKDIEWRK